MSDETKTKDTPVPEKGQNPKVEEKETKKGILRFYDGQIVFFPVSSIQGTVWITTKELIEYWFKEIKDKNGENIKILKDVKDEVYIIKWDKDLKPSSLNLGWILLKVGKPKDGKEIVLPQEIVNWVKRIVVVSDKLFSHIVNDNLEIRTSVRIDSNTGTAAKSALFTYEAIPRETVLGFEIGVDKALAKQRDIDENIVSTIIGKVSPYLRNLGIGGMGTRGFGRLEIVLKNENGGEKNAQS